MSSSQGSRGSSHFFRVVHGRLPRTALSSEVVFVLLYAGLAALIVLALQQWILFFIVQPSHLSLSVSEWWHSKEASPARWQLCGFNSLVVLWLWVRYRASSPGERRIRFIAHAGSALLVLLMHWALLSVFEALPVYSLLRVIHP